MSLSRCHCAVQRRRVAVALRLRWFRMIGTKRGNDSKKYMCEGGKSLLHCHFFTPTFIFPLPFSLTLHLFFAVFGSAGTKNRTIQNRDSIYRGEGVYGPQNTPMLWRCIIAGTEDCFDCHTPPHSPQNYNRLLGGLSPIRTPRCCGA